MIIAPGLILNNFVEKLDDIFIDVTVKATLFGHRVPWVIGTPVTFASHCNVVGGQGFRKIGTRIETSDKEDWVKLPYNSIGLIANHKFDVVDYVNRVSVTAGFLKEPAHLWYLVAFEELLWVRCDWLTIWSPDKNVKTE